VSDRRHFIFIVITHGQRAIMFRRILVPVDGSATANKALGTALKIAKQSEGEVRVVNALDELAYIGGPEYPGNIIQVAREEAEKTLDAALAAAQSIGVPADKLLIEQPAQRLGNTIAKAVDDWNADLVVGTHGRRGIGRLFLSFRGRRCPPGPHPVAAGVSHRLRCKARPEVSESPPLLAQTAGPRGTPVERIRSGLKPSPSIPAFQDTRITWTGANSDSR